MLRYARQTRIYFEKKFAPKARTGEGTSIPSTVVNYFYGPKAVAVVDVLTA